MCRRMRHLKPREIQGCQLALDASIATSLYDATSGGSLVAADGAVARIEDQSGNGRNFVQSTSGSRPLRRVASIGGRDSLEFDGTDDQMAVANVPLLRDVSSGTAVVVASRDSTTASGFYYKIIGFVSTATAAGSTRLFIASHVSTNNRSAFTGRRLDADAASINTSSIDDGTNANVYSAVMDYSATTLTGRVNTASAVVNSSFQTSGSTSNTDALSAAIGGNTTALNYFDGKIAAFAIWHSALNDSVRRRIEHGNMRKWRIAG